MELTRTCDVSARACGGGLVCVQGQQAADPTVWIPRYYYRGA